MYSKCRARHRYCSHCHNNSTGSNSTAAAEPSPPRDNANGKRTKPKIRKKNSKDSDT